MTLPEREQNRRAFKAMLAERGLTRASAAELLHVSIDTINAWLKPASSASSLPVPPWAPELLAFKRPIQLTISGPGLSVTKIRKLTAALKRMIRNADAKAAR